MKASITLPAEVWRSVALALADYLQFGPGELDAEYIPDEHLLRARRAIDGVMGDQEKSVPLVHKSVRT